MITGSSALVQVRRRDGPNLSKVSTAPMVQANAGTVVLQRLLEEVTSLKQQVNALTVARPSSMEPFSGPSPDSNAGFSSRIEPDDLDEIVD